ncbi:MAG: hypothetical protein OXF84_11225 [Bacteroidetes bacterium]|nr:hypothetical protein [Bacteroidota bacterium]
MAELYLSDREAYEASREQGGMIVFSKKPDLDKLSYVQKYFESESDACTKSGAYLAASVMIGAAIETALLFACMNNPNATMAARDKLSKKLRPKSTDPKRWSLKNLIDIAFVAGWLPDSKIDGSVFDPKYLTSMIREHRNSVHPSRHLLPSGLKSFQHAYNESRAAYVLLKWCLARSNA